MRKIGHRGSVKKTLFYLFNCDICRNNKAPDTPGQSDAVDNGYYVGCDFTEMVPCETVGEKYDAKENACL